MLKLDGMPATAQRSASLASWRPTYAAAIMLFQHTWGEEGLAQFSTNYVATSREALLG